MENYTQFALPNSAKMRLGKGKANTLEYSPDGTLLAVASNIGIWLYDANSDEELKLFTEHSDSIYNLSFSPDGKTIVSIGRSRKPSFSRTIVLWDVSNGEVIHKFPGHWLWTEDEYDRDMNFKYRHEFGVKEEISDISFSPDGKTLAVVGRYAIYLFETIDWILINTDYAENNYEFCGPSPSRFPHRMMLMHAGGIEGISFSPDGKTLASVENGYNGYIICLWDIFSGSVKKKYYKHTDYVYDISFSPDGNLLACGTSDKILLSDVLNGKIRHKLTTHQEVRYKNISFSPDGKTLASGADYDICLWDVSTGAVKQVYKETNVSCVSFSPDGKTLASIIGYIGEEAVRLWEVSGTTCERILAGHTVSFSSVLFTPDCHSLLGKDSRNFSILWDVSTGKSKMTNYYIHAMSPDCQTLAFSKVNSFWNIIRGLSPMNAGTIVLWDMLNEKLLRKLIGHRGQYINNILFSPDGKTLASSDCNYDWNRYTIRLWDVLKGKSKRKLTGHKKYIRSLSFSPDSKILVSADDGGNIFMWDISNGKIKHKLKGGARDLLFSPDGKTFVCVDGSNRTIRLWDAFTGKLKWTLTRNWGWIEDIAFSPDSRMFASGNIEDYTICLWDISTGKVVQKLDVPTLAIESISFSPDGKMLASSSSDTVLLWDLSTGKVIQEFIGHANKVMSVCFSPDSKMLGSGSSDGTVFLWEIP